MLGTFLFGVLVVWNKSECMKYMKVGDIMTIVNAINNIWIGTGGSRVCTNG